MKKVLKGLSALVLAGSIAGNVLAEDAPTKKTPSLYDSVIGEGLSVQDVQSVWDTVMREGVEYSLPSGIRGRKIDYSRGFCDNCYLGAYEGKGLNGESYKVLTFPKIIDVSESGKVYAKSRYFDVGAEGTQFEITNHSPSGTLETFTLSSPISEADKREFDMQLCRFITRALFFGYPKNQSYDAE